MIDIFLYCRNKKLPSRKNEEKTFPVLCVLMMLIEFEPNLLFECHICQTLSDFQQKVDPFSST